MPSKNEPSSVKYVVEFPAFMGLLVVGAYLLCNHSCIAVSFR